MFISLFPSVLLAQLQSCLWQPGPKFDLNTIIKYQKFSLFRKRRSIGWKTYSWLFTIPTHGKWRNFKGYLAFWFEALLMFAQRFHSNAIPAHICWCKPSSLFTSRFLIELVLNIFEVVMQTNFLGLPIVLFKSRLVQSPCHTSYSCIFKTFFILFCPFDLCHIV